MRMIDTYMCLKLFNMIFSTIIKLKSMLFLTVSFGLEIHFDIFSFLAPNLLRKYWANFDQNQYGFQSCTCVQIVGGGALIMGQKRLKFDCF